MKLRAVLLVAACSLALVSPLAAQDAVRVTFANGRVTVIAENATVAQILGEWARVGGSTFVNAEKISSDERLTLRLEDESELRAIDVLLRSVAGYAVTQKPIQSTALSSVGRVVIMPGSRPAAYPMAASTPQPVNTTNSAPPQQLFAGPPRPDDDGAVRQTTPPPAPQTVPMANAQPANAQTATVPTAQGQPGGTTPIGQATPIGQTSPLGNTKAQRTILGTTTSSQPGVVIGGPPRPNTRITPTQPKPGGGGG